MTVFYTIGYEGLSLPDFVKALEKAGVGCLADIRKIAYSRKPGFSKDPLRAALAAAGIQYVHLEGLGNPLKGREATPGTDYRTAYENHLKDPVAQRDLAKLIEIMEGCPTCLMCFEKDHKDCHRHLTALAVQGRTGLNVIHLGPEDRQFALSL